MKFSSTDKRSETVSLIRNKKIYFIGTNKCMIKKNRVLACFQTRPEKCTIRPLPARVRQRAVVRRHVAVVLHTQLPVNS